jgi:hypothetical protein
MRLNKHNGHKITESKEQAKANTYILTVLSSPISVCRQKMLQYEPSKRITARQALEHEYFKDHQMVQ